MSAAGMYESLPINRYEHQGNACYYWPAGWIILLNLLPKLA
jgi:hypothetical protein